MVGSAQERLATSAPPYADLAAAWRALRGRVSGFSLREIACVGADRTLLLVEIAREPGAPVVSLASGLHGDEPAGPWSLYALVRDGLLDGRFAYRIWPCLNPTGYALGTRANADGVDVNRSFSGGGQTPEARAVITANRDRRFVLSFDLHEDFEASGFYCYEPGSIDVSPQYAPAIITALDALGLPVQSLDNAFDLGYPSDAHHIRQLARGFVRNDHVAERAFFAEQPYTIALLRRATPRALTCESPRATPWDVRLAIHRIAVVTALTELAAELGT